MCSINENGPRHLATLSPSLITSPPHHPQQTAFRCYVRNISLAVSGFLIILTCISNQKEYGNLHLECDDKKKPR